MWNFSNCCGAVDGKHVALRQSVNTGSLFFNYKNHFSVVPMALVHHQYRFVFVYISNYGRNLILEYLGILTLASNS